MYAREAADLACFKIDDQSFRLGDLFRYLARLSRLMLRGQHARLDGS